MKYTIVACDALDYIRENTSYGRLYKLRPNKKDSFERWYNRVRKLEDEVGF